MGSLRFGACEFGSVVANSLCLLDISLGRKDLEDDPNNVIHISQLILHVMPLLQFLQADDYASQMTGRLQARAPWRIPSCRRAAGQSVAAAMRGARQVLRGALFLAAILAIARAARARAARPRFRSPTLQPIKSGIDAMSAALWGRQNSCQKNAASSEEKLARIKYVVDSQWEMLGKADEKVKALEEKMEELIAIKEDYAEATPDPEGEGGRCLWQR